MEFVRSEFRWQHLGFGGVPTTAFVSSQVHQNIVYAYRILVALYQLSWNIAVPAVWGHPSFYRQPADDTAKWLIYLSNWSFCVLTLYLVVAAGSILANRRQTRRQVADADELVAGDGDMAHAQDNQPQQEDTPLPWCLKLTWLLQTVAYSACAFVTFGYWIIQFKPGVTIVQIFTIHVHGISLIIVLIDMIVAAPPVRLLHFVYPYLYFLLYQLFAFVYYKSGGTNPEGDTYIYKGFIDWGQAPTATLLVLLVGTALVVPFLHAIFFALSKLRTAIAKKCYV